MGPSGSKQKLLAEKVAKSKGVGSGSTTFATGGGSMPLTSVISATSQEDLSAMAKRLQIATDRYVPRLVSSQRADA